MVIFIMGVSGSGKSSIGRLLGKELELPFIEGDDHHPKENIEKMSQGKPLNDSDRQPWLEKIHGLALEQLGSGCIIACSALKENYRKTLSRSIESQVQWIYLKGNYNQILERMEKRKNHFMRPEMLRSQFETLDPPENAITVDIGDEPKRIVEQIKRKLK